MMMKIKKITHILISHFNFFLCLSLCTTQPYTSLTRHPHLSSFFINHQHADTPSLSLFGFSSVFAKNLVLIYCYCLVDDGQFCVEGGGRGKVVSLMGSWALWLWGGWVV
ncbi:hypothetical protein PGTUg99_007396 [Puccinia graminis f. sp. tritici]|uniref:Transmembrane protein n=1 Tax=Puccinia graminis f. sp. tritici TaxID=56615 RepID=A0A5B0RVL1_PUCGR|nr:hypothetical protein PGTUg99_007396 [Puccinia graminis f. sp. tritici]